MCALPLTYVVILTFRPSGDRQSFSNSSQAVTEVLRLLTGFARAGIRKMDLMLADAPTMRGYKKFDGIAGTLQEWGGTRRTDCPHCGNILGGGDIVFTSSPPSTVAA
jgi:hypothetical protein